MTQPIRWRSTFVRECNFRSHPVQYSSLILILLMFHTFLTILISNIRLSIGNRGVIVVNGVVYTARGCLIPVSTYEQSRLNNTVSQGNRALTKVNIHHATLRSLASQPCSRITSSNSRNVPDQCITAPREGA